MIGFVNAKINIGLQIVRKRADGYHDLQTVFYPVGLYAGTPSDESTFCDILEICRNDSGAGGFEFITIGRKVECAPEKNLVYRAAQIFSEYTGADLSETRIVLDKHLPDGAGLGGGSADATCTLRMLSDTFYPDKDLPLMEMARRLGADCPFFLINRAAYAEGTGDRLEEIPLDLSGYWIVIVKPDIYVSTREAFSGVTPRESDFDLREIPRIPIEEWKGRVKNDFEDSIFPLHPGIGEVKEGLYKGGALYASMSGSGSSVYGIFADRDAAAKTADEFREKATIATSCLLKM